MLRLWLVVATLCLATAKPVADEATCGYDACPTYDPEALNVHLVAHSHDDVGYQLTKDQYFYQSVQFILTSVIVALRQNPARRYIQVETAFFAQWWEKQDNVTKDEVRDLVNSGRLEIVNGAWSMNDEAAVHYQSTIDQFTLGLRYIEDAVGECGRPRTGWQIDPFGHSREHASLSSQFGFDSLFFARVDYRDRNARYSEKNTDFIWKASDSLDDAEIFTNVLYNSYQTPPAFCFDCGDPPMMIDKESPSYNVDQRVNDFANFVREQADNYPTNNVMITMGGDFKYTAGLTGFINIDRLIDGFDEFPQEYNGRPLKVYYSTPSCYAKGVNEYVNANNYDLSVKNDDFFPYADGPTTVWSGYYTSRPASKRFERVSNNFLQVAKQLGVVAGENYGNPALSDLRKAMGIMQHHDAITGTEKQAVANNYHLMVTKALQAVTESVTAVLSGLLSGGASEDLALGHCLLANVSVCPLTNSEQFSVVVYNPLSRVVTSPVSLPVYSDRLQVVGPDGRPVNYQVNDPVKDFSYTGAEIAPFVLDFGAVDLPPLGYKVYTVSSGGRSPNRSPVTKAVAPRVGYLDTSVELDASTGLLRYVTMNGITMDVSQDLLYYPSDQYSGPYLLVPGGEAQRLASGVVRTTPISGPAFEGVIQEFNEWATQIIKVYSDDRSFIEIEWIVGPVDVGDGMGKEVISRFTTPYQTNQIWYTDSSGREMLRRTRNSRPDYTYSDEEPVAGNYYPVNSKIVIRDEQQQLELAVLTDRSEGGSSLADGQVELMIQRTCLGDDGRGVGEPLNEQQYGQGIVVRGKHYLVLGLTSVGDTVRSLPAVERDLAQRKLLEPLTFVTTSAIANPEFSALSRPLPENVHLLTLEPWGEGVVLIRLEHALEIGEDPVLSRGVTVDLSDLFVEFTVTELQETTLAANMAKESNVKLQWHGRKAHRESVPRDVDDLTVDLQAMQIRTFLASVVYN